MESPRKPARGRFAAPALFTLVVAVLTACHSGSPQPPPASSAPATSPATTAPSVSAPSAPAPSTSAPSTPSVAPTTAAVTTAPTSGVPDPRSVPVPSLLRPGARPVRVLYGDLDGDGVEDIVVASVAAPSGASVPQSYLDVFLHRGGRWRRGWAATGPAPPGVDGAPASVLETAGQVTLGQQIDSLALVDMAGDGTPELTIGVLNQGAGPGPLDVWVIGFGTGGPTTRFWEETAQGGILLAAGTTLRLQAPSFGPDDPSCCPSRIEHQTIGFDPGTGTVRVLHRSFTPTG